MASSFSIVLPLYSTPLWKGKFNPFALLDEDDFPALLAHAERSAGVNGGEFGVQTPLINRNAIGYFLDHKYEIESFITLFMSNEPFCSFENYLCISPILFM